MANFRIVPGMYVTVDQEVASLNCDTLQIGTELQVIGFDRWSRALAFVGKKGNYPLKAVAGKLTPVKIEE